MPLIPTTLIVKFKKDVSRIVVKEFLKTNRLDGVVVSDFLNRWAVDAPPGKEEYYSKLLKENYLVDSVCSTTVKGFIPQKREKSERPKPEVQKEYKERENRFSNKVLRGGK